MNFRKLILVEQHFHPKGQDFNKDMTFAIIKKNRKNTLDIITPLIEIH